jgi:hypothetical protein
MDNIYEHSKQHVCLENCSLTISLHTLVRLLYLFCVFLLIGKIKDESTEEREQLVEHRLMLATADLVY